MNEFSLFTGAGGGVLASILLRWRTVGYVEWDGYCQRVIRQRISDGIFDDAPIFGDIREFDGAPWRGYVDVITAGFPCQPFSVAGRQLGAGDSRNLWPETLRVIREVRPRYAFLENVPGLISSGYFGTILSDLAESRYDAEWCVLGADDVGAPHRRKRLWILAYTCESGFAQRGNDARRSKGRESDCVYSEPAGLADTPDVRGEAIERSEQDGILRQDVAYAASQGLQRPGITQGGEERLDTLGCGDKSRVTWWDTDPAEISDSIVINDDGSRHGTSEICREQSGQANLSGGEDLGIPEIDCERPGLCAEKPSRNGRGRSCNSGPGPTQPRLGRVAHGVANRVDRLKAIGNGQVPIVAAGAWCMLRKQVNKFEDLDFE